VPPHRPAQPHASAFHRFAMTALAVQELTVGRACDLELSRPGPSYSIDTLRLLHADGWHPSQIFFIIGTDAFAEMATWRGFPAILDACHFTVISRAGADLVLPTPDARARVSAAGEVNNGGSTRIVPVPATTRPVSSTEIRNHRARGLAIDALVPATVAAHIVRHGLYRAGQGLAS